MNLPKEFETYTRQLFGDELYSKFVRALDEEAPTSVRVRGRLPLALGDLSLAPSEGGGMPKGINTTDTKVYDNAGGGTDNNVEGTAENIGGVAKILGMEVAGRVPWCENGYYLKGRPAFTFDPLFHAGLYYVQESSSMFVCEVVRRLIHKPVMMLDLCAAPGGKTTALRSSLPEGSLLFSNEPVKNRASILKENVIKFGHPDVIVTNNYPRDYKKAGVMFDAILADVPCSGEGMFRKDPNAVGEWSVANVEKCRQLQRSIIEDIWQCLKPGGLLIYSTCTFNAHEDEENVKWIEETLGAESLNLDPSGLPLAPSEVGGKSNTANTVNTNGADGDDIDTDTINAMPMKSPWGDGLRFIPGVTHGEGLYMAMLRKNGGDGDRKEAASSGSHRNESVGGKAGGKNGALQVDWLKGDFAYLQEKDFIRAIPARWLDIYNKVKGKLHIIHAGVGIGTVKGKSIVPDTSLALSLDLDRKAFPQAELDYDTAIRYLRKEAIVLDASVPRGFTIVTYKGAPLGFVKNLGNRANNLYPQEWRIKSSHIPTSV